MSDRYSGKGAGAGGNKEYFTQGRGPGRGDDIANSRKGPKQSRRGVGDGDPMEIDLTNLNQPGTGPVDLDELARGRILPRLTTEQLGKEQGDID